MFTIYDLSEKENELIKESKRKYGNFFDNANNIVNFSWSFISNPRPESWIFHAFYTQCVKHLSLALLSVLRRHTIQAEQDMRQALESCVLTCYALKEPKENEFVYMLEDGTLQPKNKERHNKKRFKWIDENYKYHSDKIKYFKDRINDNFAHANFVNALMNVRHDFETGVFNSDYFDNNDIWLIKIQLWMISNNTLGMMELISMVLRDYPLAKIKPEFKDRMEIFWVINQRQKENIKDDSNFPELLRSLIE
jgi:hypothetical protein